MLLHDLFMQLLGLLAFLLTPSAALNTASPCSPGLLEFPNLQGAKSLNISAREVYNYSDYSLAPGTNNPGTFTIDFCNVTVSYTHPGWNDNIHVNVWLPLKNWNGRLMALGGGGLSAGFGSLYLTRAVAKGYVAIDTDAGHVTDMANAQWPSSWALTSTGNVNLLLLDNYASRSLQECSVIGKAITKSYFNAAPKFSYFAGCSGGGRQGLMIAQRYPDAYDGILAMSPAIYLDTFAVASYWPQQVMKKLDHYPPPCEVDAFTKAAIESCDELDGLKDGLISDQRRCNFNPHSIVGQSFSCNGTTRQFSAAGASAVEAAWTGPRNSLGNLGWFGFNKDAILSSSSVATLCESPDKCSAPKPSLPDAWIIFFAAKDANFVTANMTEAEYFTYFQTSQREYHSMLGTSDPDLSKFRDAGSKMIVWHGLGDSIIPPLGTVAYYQQVLKLDPKASDYFRFFEAPGVDHCFSISAPTPNAAFDHLVAWVEQNVLPETLNATDVNGTMRPLCPYPKKQTYMGGDSKDPRSFKCLAGSEDPAKSFVATDFPFFRVY